jgi:hypothetical protein
MSCSTTCRTRRLLPALLLLVLPLLARGAAWADLTYKIQPIVKQGDTVGTVKIRPDADFEIGTLNDNGQLAFVTENAAGGETLIQFADGNITPIVVSGKDAPGGKWNTIFPGVALGNMNQLGNIVFTTYVLSGGKSLLGTFLWDAKAQKVTAIAVSGMPAVNNLTFEAGWTLASHLNNLGDIVFSARVKNAAGTPAAGVFFLGRDGKLQAVALPDQELPDGKKVDNALLPSLNDAGRVAFVTASSVPVTSPVPSEGAYVWDGGVITPLVTVGTDLPGSGRLANVGIPFLNNKNQDVLMLARVGNLNGPFALYRITDGKLTPLVVPGQEMPGGGKVESVIFGNRSVNDAGQSAFTAQLQGGATGLYLLEADGKVSLVLKSRATTELGAIQSIGEAGSSSSGVGLNNKGQIAVPIRFASGPAMIVLLTPTTP